MDILKNTNKLVKTYGGILFIILYDYICMHGKMTNIENHYSHTLTIKICYESKSKYFRLYDWFTKTILYW